jgi:hypothetical protein
VVTPIRLQKEDTMYALEGAMAAMLFSALAILVMIALLLIVT